MRNRMTFLLLALIFIFVLGACNNHQNAKLDIAFLGNTDSDCISEKSNVISMASEKYNNRKASRSKQISINNAEYTLTYNESAKDVFGSMDTYATEDEKIECKYENGKLSQIIVDDITFESLSTEEEYVNWCKTFISNFDNVDFSKYTYSCITYTNVSGDNYLSGRQYPYFYNEFEDNEEINIYTFTFTKFISGLPTTDRFSISIFSKINWVSVKLDHKQFVDISTIDIDENEIDSKVEEFVKNNIDSKYSYSSHEIKDRTLYYIDGRLCCVNVVSLSFSPVYNTEIDFKSLINVVVYLDDVEIVYNKE